MSESLKYNEALKFKKRAGWPENRAEWPEKGKVLKP